MRAFDCTAAMHEAAHFTAESDELLMEKVLAHFAEYHPEVAVSQVREIVGMRAYDDDREPEELTPSDRVTPLERGIRPVVPPER
jgi:hypothetical protein